MGQEHLMPIPSRVKGLWNLGWTSWHEEVILISKGENKSIGIGVFTHVHYIKRKYIIRFRGEARILELTDWD